MPNPMSNRCEERHLALSRGTVRRPPAPLTTKAVQRVRPKAGTRELHDVSRAMGERDSLERDHSTEERYRTERFGPQYR
eukprot:scaffold97438_cov63-Phaeocystis_antarctica.AAC.2